MEGRDCGLL